MSNSEEYLPVQRRGLRLNGPGFLALLTLVGFAAWKESGGDGWAAAILLSLSIGLDFFVLRGRAPESKFANDLAWCEILKIFFLFCYVFGGRICLALGWASLTPILGRVGGALALVIAVVVTGLMLKVASEMLDPNGPADALIEELQRDKMLAIAGVLLAFLHVTYLMTFALAISNRANKSDLFAHSYVDEKRKCPTDAEGAPLCDTEDLYRVRQLYFTESAASLTCTEQLRKAVFQQKRNNDICESRLDLEQRVRALDDIDLAACHSVELKTDPSTNANLNPKAKAKAEAEANFRYSRRSVAIWNVFQLYELRAVFRKIACAGKGKSYQIEICGHANDTKFKTDPARAYSSDFEISKQRADQVELILGNIWREATGGVEAPPVRWLAYGMSNEPAFLELTESKWPKQKSDPEKEKEKSGLEKELSVEVRILKIDDPFHDGRPRSASSDGRTLNLTDYLYFTVYTITTTGYGDIIPVSPYAEFVVTIANLMELLFIVLLVNVVANAHEPMRETISRQRPTEGADDGTKS